MKKSIILVLIPFFIFGIVWSSSAQIKKDGLHFSLYSGTSLQGIERVSGLDLRLLFSEHSTFYSPIKYGPFKTFQPKLVLTVSKYFSKKTIISSTISRSNTHYKFLPKLIWARNESFNDIQRIKPLNYFNINFPYTQFSIGINKTIIETNRLEFLTGLDFGFRKYDNFNNIKFTVLGAFADTPEVIQEVYSAEFRATKNRISFTYALNLKLNYSICKKFYLSALTTYQRVTETGITSRYILWEDAFRDSPKPIYFINPNSFDFTFGISYIID